MTNDTSLAVADWRAVVVILLHSVTLPCDTVLAAFLGQGACGRIVGDRNVMGRGGRPWNINNETQIRIRDAMLHAYGTLGQLTVLVSDVFDLPLGNVVNVAHRLETVMFDLIRELVSRGRLVELVLGAADRRPGDPKLRPLVDGIRNVGQAYGKGAFSVGDYRKVLDAAPGELETVVLEKLQFQHVGPWLERLARLRRVCRVEPRPQADGVKGYGSGFLVGPDVVMTNCHVVRPFLDGKAAASGCGCGSISRRAADGVAVAAGRAVPLADDWKVLLSPEAELDFALVRLAEKAGTDNVAGKQRGSVDPKPYAFTAAEPLLILQHPAAEPLKLALGSVTTPDYNHTRVEYNVSTLGGSSRLSRADQRLGRRGHSLLRHPLSEPRRAVRRDPGVPGKGREPQKTG